MTITAKFASPCTRCGSIIAKDTRVEWTRGRGVRHLTDAECERARATAPPQAPAAAPLALQSIVTFLQAARDRGLLWPKARFLAPGGGELRISLAGNDSRNPGALYVKVDGEYRGLVTREGQVRGDRRVGDRALDRDGAMRELLAAVATDPARFAREYGATMGYCAFCHKRLTDDRTGASVEHGYGPDCAERYGLEWRGRGRRRTALLEVPVQAQGPSRTQAEIDADERAMNAAVQAAERAEDERVADYKARRDSADSVDRADAYYSARLGF
jgi:Family of unknown function (DUF6011)